MSELCDMALFNVQDSPYAIHLKPFDPSKLEDNMIIYCVTDQAETLYRILRQAKKKVFIIFGRSVVTVNDSFIPFVEELGCLHIFSQNCTINNDFFTPIPLGLENRHFFVHSSPSNSISLLSSYIEQQNIRKRDQSLFASFSLITNKTERKECLLYSMQNQLTRLNMTFDPSISSSQQYFYQQLITSKYSICPWGNGIDTHRFWQSLYLGCIPITRKHRALETFYSIGGVFLDSWKQLESINMNATYQIDYEKLYFPYWQRKIRTIIESKI